MGEDLPLIAPVPLGLSTRNNLEPRVQTRQLAGTDAQFLRDPWPGFTHIRGRASPG